MIKMHKFSVVELLEFNKIKKMWSSTVVVQCVCQMRSSNVVNKCGRQMWLSNVGVKCVRKTCGR
jgi:hypothetical protein